MMVLLWGGMNYLGALHHRKLKVMQQSRSCAWQTSVSSCEKVPPRCQATSTPGKTPSKGSTLSSAGGQGHAKTAPLQKKLDSKIEGIFRKHTTAESGEDVAPPRMFGTRAVTVASEFHLVCNTKPQGALEQVQGLLGDLLSGFF